MRSVRFTQVCKAGGKGWPSFEWSLFLGADMERQRSLNCGSEELMARSRLLRRRAELRLSRRQSSPADSDRKMDWPAVIQRQYKSCSEADGVTRASCNAYTSCSLSSDVFDDVDSGLPVGEKYSAEDKDDSLAREDFGRNTAERPLRSRSARSNFPERASLTRKFSTDCEQYGSASTEKVSWPSVGSEDGLDGDEQDDFSRKEKITGAFRWVRGELVSTAFMIRLVYTCSLGFPVL